MANQEQLRRLRQGVEEWNQWRKENPYVQIDLREAILSGANLGGVDLHDADLRRVHMIKADLREADLREAKLIGANLGEADLRGANLGEADLCRAYLNQANLFGANLCGAKLIETNLVEADLIGADLVEADLIGADLIDADLMRARLTDANLGGAKLIGADLRKADLRYANLSGANLRQSQMLGTNFESASLTGVCIEDWNINSDANLKDIVCEHIYLKENAQERRPHGGSFQPEEFATLVQQIGDTVDLIFKDGIDWQAFFQSFQELRSQYAHQDLSIQAIEKKRGGAFVVRLEVSEDIDKVAVEEKVKVLYGEQLKQIEGRYQQLLQLQGQQLDDYREQVQERKQENSRLLGIVETMAEKESISKYDLRGAQFGGGYVAGNVEGNQYGGIINNYGSNAEDITRLLAALRDQAQTFPTDQKDDANDVLDLLERDLAEEQPDQGRIGRRLKKLVAIATTLTIGATAFIADLVQLADVLNVPLPQIEQVQPEPLPPSD
ncbi:MAG: pentapeptide repeat-containing protein [Cyanobacteria bacterium P01_H01_bin.58]